jgi:hypothetical protein
MNRPQKDDPPVLTFDQFLSFLSALGGFANGS